MSGNELQMQKRAVDLIFTDISSLIYNANTNGKGFERSAVFKMVKFYQEFPEYEKVATLSQQLTWSHFVGLYLTKMPPKKLLEEKLSLAIANAKEQLEQREV